MAPTRPSRSSRSLLQSSPRTTPRKRTPLPPVFPAGSPHRLLREFSREVQEQLVCPTCDEKPTILKDTTDGIDRDLLLVSLMSLCPTSLTLLQCDTDGFIGYYDHKTKKGKVFGVPKPFGMARPATRDAQRAFGRLLASAASTTLPVTLDSANARSARPPRPRICIPGSLPAHTPDPTLLAHDNTSEPNISPVQDSAPSSPPNITLQAFTVLVPASSPPTTPTCSPALASPKTPTCIRTFTSRAIPTNRALSSPEDNGPYIPNGLLPRNLAREFWVPETPPLRRYSGSTLASATLRSESPSSDEDAIMDDSEDIELLMQEQLEYEQREQEQHKQEEGQSEEEIDELADDEDSNDEFGSQDGSIRCEYDDDGETEGSFTYLCYLSY